MLSFNEILLSFFLSLTAWVFVNILQDEDMLLYRWRDVLKKLPKWLAYPLGDCDLCLAGQLAFWVYIFKGDYTLSGHLFFVMLSIFFIKLIDRYGLR